MVGKGRRKAENKLVENKGARFVSFSKRRTGLFKKARELPILTGAQVGALALSPASKPMEFDDPTLAPILKTLIGAHELIFSELLGPERCDDWETLFYKALEGKTGTLWWEKADVQSMKPEELQRFQGAILSYNEKLALNASFLASEQQYADGRFTNASLEQESSFEQQLDISPDLVPDLASPFSMDSKVLDDSMDTYIMNFPWDSLPELLGDEFQ